jgi:hypothetical protein
MNTWGGRSLLAASRSNVGSGVGAGVLVGVVITAVGTGVFAGARVAVGAGVSVAGTTVGAAVGTAVGAVVGTGVGSDPQAIITNIVNARNIASPYCLFTLNPSPLSFPNQVSTLIHCRSIIVADFLLRYPGYYNLTLARHHSTRQFFVSVAENA